MVESYATAMDVPPYWYHTLVPSATMASDAPGLSAMEVMPVVADAPLETAIVPAGVSAEIVPAGVTCLCGHPSRGGFVILQRASRSFGAANCVPVNVGTPFVPAGV